MNLFLRILRALLQATEGNPQQAVRAVRERQQSTEQGHPPAPISVTVHSELQLPQAVIDEHKADQGKQGRRDVRDKVRLGVEAGVLVAVILGFWFNWQQLNATRRAVEAANRASDTAARQLEAMDRPWITADVVVAAPFRVSDDKVNVFLSFSTTVKNIGRSVAQNVGIKIVLYPQAFNSIFTEPVDRQRALCSTDTPKMKYDGFLKMTLFPNESDQQGSSFGLGLVDITKVAATFDKGIPYTPLQPVLVGCVTYEFGTSARVHHTYFAYEVVRTTTIEPNLPHLFDIANLPSDVRFIKLMRYPNAKTNSAD